MTLKMFERPPYSECNHCKRRDGVGTLHVGSDHVTFRCRYCREKRMEILPEVEKAVVYLDQSAISELYKVKSKTRRADAMSTFWNDVYTETNKAYLLQQVIFPASDIHFDETIVSPFASELSLAHEMLSGDVSFKSTDEIALQQVIAFAQVYFDGGQSPQLSYSVDEILDGQRNRWLPDLHISVNTNFSFLSPRIRATRDSRAGEFLPLFDKWQTEKKSFRDVLNFELASFGAAKRSALQHATEGLRAINAHDTLEMLEALSPPIRTELIALQDLLKQRKVSIKDCYKKISEFWDWKENENIPEHRICCYLFASIAHRLASGQRRRPTRGMMNDIKAIATYAPYVDAIFVDNECAQILSEGPLREELKYKAKVFSVRNGNAYLEYLRDLQRRTSSETKRFANRLYGIDI